MLGTAELLANVSMPVLKTPRIQLPSMQAWLSPDFMNRTRSMKTAAMP